MLHEVTQTNKANHFFKKIILKLCAKLEVGSITLIDPEHTFQFGQLDKHNKHATVTIHNMRFYQKILLGGSVGAAESYMQEDWEVDDLVSLIEIIIMNEYLLVKVDSGFSKFANWAASFLNFFIINNKSNAKKFILSHYDLGNEFFKTFLDETLLYSSAVYPTDESDLQEASLNKLKIIGESLQLQPSDHVLEIGTGWGGLACFMAQQYGCNVTTTTISDKQYLHVREEIKRRGLQHKITLLNKDYRDLQGSYDKLVSIEMVEAIGHRNFDNYFAKCNGLLKSGGLFFLQAILINDRMYEQARVGVDFIKKYIFPGGCLPSMRIISNCIAKNTNLQLVKLNDIGPHYARTLLDWLKNFDNSLLQIQQLKFTNSFIRMWRYYFCYCAASFKQAYITDIQAVWRKR